jgi:hypothetical protein
MFSALYLLIRQINYPSLFSKTACFYYSTRSCIIVFIKETIDKPSSGKRAHGAMIIPLVRELPTRVQILVASGGGVKPTYKVGCSLYTCKCVEERGKGETHTLARLTSPGGAGRGGVRRGNAR